MTSTSHTRAVPVLLALIVPKGPVFHFVTDSFSKLKECIAMGTPCNVTLLSAKGLTWKFERPLDAPWRVMANQAGYDAMITAVKAKPLDTCTIEMYMPLPRKNMVGDYPSIILKHCWLILALANWGPKSSWQCVWLQWTSCSSGTSNLSAKDQIVSVQQRLTYLSLCDHKEIMAHKLLENVQALKECYPQDNDVENSGMAVYQNSDRCWQLNDIHYKVWGAAIISIHSFYCVLMCTQYYLNRLTDQLHLTSSQHPITLMIRWRSSLCWYNLLDSHKVPCHFSHISNNMHSNIMPILCNNSITTLHLSTTILRNTHNCHIPI